jgi:hypothetical protein
MSDKPGVGKTIWNQEITRGRNAADEARRALRRINDEQPGPATTNALLTAAALSIAEILTVLNELDKIGREAKSKPPSKKRTLKTDS